MERLLTITEAAAKLGISSQRVQQIIADGAMKTERVGKNGRFVRIRQSEVARCKAEREQLAARQIESAQ